MTVAITSNSIDLFKKHVAEIPEKKAVFYKNKSYSYKELDQLSNAMSSYLITAGVGKETPVILFAKPTIESLVAIFAILKSGGVCVPANPDFPISRLEEVTDKAKAILTTNDLVANLPEELSSKILNINQIMGETEKQENVDFPTIDPEQGAFIIYTSGSTGKPNGVVMNHRNLANMAVAAYPIDEKDVCCLTASISFVASLRQIFSPLCLGASLVIVESQKIKDPQQLFQVIKEQNVTILNLVTSYCKTCAQVLAKPQYEDLLNSCELNKMVASGEKLSVDIVEDWQQLMPNLLFYNGYGQTETTSGIMLNLLPKNLENYPANVPVGKPTGTNKIYILDENLQQLPKGTIGEMYVASEEIARNYYNDPKTTASRFIPNPFSTEPILYKSGDLARINDNDEVEIIGRSDFQVKIRGFRVNTLEIEIALRKLPGVSDAAVIFSDDILKAYIVSDKKLVQKDIREYLQLSLPEYMIPHQMYKISTLATTSTGKTDYLTLKQLDKKQRFLFTPKWELSEKLLQIETDKKLYLLFAEEPQFQDNDNIISVSPGSNFSVSDKNITIDFQSESHHAQLIKHLQSLDFDFTNILYAHPDIRFFTTTLKSFAEYLSQMRVAIICRNVFPIGNAQNICPENAAITGISRVLPLEYPGLRYACIDIGQQPLSNEILHELEHGLPAQNVVYANKNRYTMDYEPVIASEKMIEDGEVYLITGGLGNIGLNIALSLAKKAKAKIAITTRNRSNISEKVQQSLNQIDELGAEVAIFESSLDNNEQVKEIADEIHKKLGSVHGVIHCAGAREHFALTTTPNIIDEKYKFKIDSAQILLDIFAERNAQYIILFSSLSSLLGRYGQAGYCAASAYLDAFAHKNSQSNLKIISADWDVWKELPLPTSASIPCDINELIRSDAQNGISNNEGFKALLKMATSSYQQVIISSRSEITGYTINEILSESKFIEATTELEKKLVSIWCDVLKLDKISINDNFFDIGGHSLLTIVLMDKIRQVVGMESDDHQGLPISLLLSYPTIKRLASAIDNKDDVPQEQTIQMNSKIDGTPVFLVHAPHVDPICYRHLSDHLDGKKTVYTIRTDELAVDASIEETASYHIEKIKEIQPSGPYIFGGMCMGGLVTFEVAYQLHKRGDKINLAFIMDAINIPGMEDYKTQEIHEAGKGKRKIINMQKAGEFLKHLAKGDVQFISKKIKRVKRKIERKINKVSDPRAKLKKKMRDQLRIIGDKYRPQYYDGQIIYIRSEKKRGDYSEKRLRELAKEVQSHRLEGTIHSDVSRPLFAKQTSEIVQKYLNI
ncbi:amino acid adenylation domain-containing protein [Candidatus Uabimicrobium sp. HlEnr_7]|uniref:amino acid adenylation domain-containing protein n=1 Tax=Candidatus Uabimicrobium helgolandensis TaxID=3095367 RepID=UPI0035572ED8